MAHKKSKSRPKSTPVVTEISPEEVQRLILKKQLRNFDDDEALWLAKGTFTYMEKCAEKKSKSRGVARRYCHERAEQFILQFPEYPNPEGALDLIKEKVNNFYKNDKRQLLERLLVVSIGPDKKPRKPSALQIARRLLAEDQASEYDEQMAVAKAKTQLDEFSLRTTVQKSLWEEQTKDDQDSWLQKARLVLEADATETPVEGGDASAEEIAELERQRWAARAM